MALRMATLKCAVKKMGYALGPIRRGHTIAAAAAAAKPPPLERVMNHSAFSSQLILPELDRNSESSNNNFGFEFPMSTFGGGLMELMAVPKRKVSPHKRGIRNGPKALKPIPVIIRCKSCGRVKLPHFYCCSGDRGNTGEPNSSSR
ncbi:hypothetical protein U1Q18_016842 [Sarracenia purpurea var. burkii]